MKPLDITIVEARSIEHALEKAIQDAELSMCGHNSSPDTRLTKVVFKRIEARIVQGHVNFFYTFEASFEEGE